MRRKKRKRKRRKSQMLKKTKRPLERRRRAATRMQTALLRKPPALRPTARSSRLTMTKPFLSWPTRTETTSKKSAGFLYFGSRSCRRGCTLSRESLL
jgi:hypothetical protein